MQTLIDVQTFGNPWLNIKLPFPCELHWLRPRYEIEKFKNNDARKVLIMNNEPSPWCMSDTELLDCADQFDLVISKTNENNLKNCIVMLFGLSTISEKLPKQFGISNLLSMGNHSSLLSGHLFRIALSARLDNFSIPEYEIFKSQYFDLQLNKIRQEVQIFTSTIPTYPYESKSFLSRKTHNLAIENHSEKNYFSEKIMDCFRTLTVPIYWGCTNIDDYFDSRGIIFLPDLEQSIDIIKSISADDYLKRMPYIIENYERSKNYWNFLDRLKDVIQNNLK
jgi:hypothetical protein